MSEHDHAVFLSYASQDADAARRICEALRAAGVEVWFDQSELRGGDAWDAKIRKQIKECALFVPIISANTQARQEGYFRLEWRLADQRTHLMSHDRAFLLPVTIDGTSEQGARVPESFVAVQWTPVRDEAGATKFASRVQAVLQGGAEAAPVAEQSPVARAAKSGRVARRARHWPIWATLGVLAAAAVALAFLQPWRRSATAPVSEARTLVLQARALIDDDLMAVRENFRNAEELCQKAVSMDNADGEAWATLARVSCGFIHRSYDTSPQRLEAAQTQAQRAVQLAPASIEAGLAMADYFRVTGNYGEAVRRLRELLTRAPRDWRVALQLAGALESSGAGEEARQIRLHHPSFGGRDPRPLIGEALELRREGRLGEAEAMVDRAQAIAPTPEGFRYKLVILGLEGDNLPAAIAHLKTVPPGVFLEDAFASRAAQVYLRAEDGAKALEVLRRIPRELFEERGQNQPRGYLAGWALSVGGKYAAAEAEWRAALAAIEKRLVVDPNNTRWLYWKAMLLALLGQRDEAEKTHRLEVELRGIPAPHYTNASLLVALQKNEEAIRAVESLREEQRRTTALQMVHGLRRDPWFAAIRDDARVQKLIADLGATSANAGHHAARAATPAPEKSVAVLAFENRSSEKDSEYFSDGVSDELINVLGRVSGLKVIARTSSFAFKNNKTASTTEIARALGVTHLVEGSVQQAGGKARVIARLVRADTGEQVWGDSFEPEVKDILTAQVTTARAIAEALTLRLNAGPGMASLNPEAVKLYLQGRQEWGLRTIESMRRAEDLFTRAITLEPKFARAHSGLVDAWVILGQLSDTLGLFGERDSVEMRRILERARMAVALDPESTEAHASLGGALEEAWRPVEARQALERAVELNPNYATAHHWLGRALLRDGRAAEAIASLRRACELDPLSSRMADNLGIGLWLIGREQEALVEIDRALRLQPDSEQARAQRAMVLAAAGRRDEAVAQARAALPRAGWLAMQAVYALAVTGQQEEAGRALASLPNTRALSRGAVPLAALGRWDECLAALQPATMVPGIAHQVLFHPVFDPVRGDPRFVTALEALGLTEAHARAQAWRAANPPQKVPAKK